MEKRETSFGESNEMTMIDRFGVWLSNRRIRKILRNIESGTVADIGCGYEASLLPTLLSRVAYVYLVDISLNEQLGHDDRVKIFNGYLPDVLNEIPDHSIDLVIMNSVLEHLDDPLTTLFHVRRILNHGGILFVNVPTWLGKGLLEFSAFRLRLSPAEEMEDHRRYYNNKQLWQEIRMAGFTPSRIKVKRHKFGLNVFCVAEND